MISLCRYTALFLIFTFPLTFPVISLAEQAEGGIGGEAQEKAGPPGLVKEWESEPLKNIIYYEGKGRPNITRPTWAVFFVGKDKSDKGPPYFWRGASKYYHLVHFGPEGKVQRKTLLGMGSSILISEDGHRFVIGRQKWNTEEYISGVPGTIVKDIVDNAGHVKRSFENIRPTFLGPGGSHMIRLDSERVVIEVYDSRLKLTATYGEPASPSQRSYDYAAADGIFAVALRDGGFARFYLFDRSGKLMFEPEKVEVGGFSTMKIYPKQELVVLQGKKKLEGKKFPVTFLRLVNLHGEEVSQEMDLLFGFPVKTQVSDNGRYIRVFNKDISYLFSRDGELLYSLFTSSFDEMGAGELTDDGMFIGFMSKWQNLVVVDRDGNVEELPIPKPKKVRAFDAKRGLILSEEDQWLGKDSKGKINWQTRYVQRRIPTELLAEVHRKGGL